jgi:predicted molibdopterin-dependent oxidoreductase YjgC
MALGHAPPGQHGAHQAGFGHADAAWRQGQFFQHRARHILGGIEAGEGIEAGTGIKAGAGIEAGAIKTLLVFGVGATQTGIPESVLGKLDTLVVSDVLPGPISGGAHYVLPGCAVPEKRGTLINAKGRVQKFMKAVEPPGDARPEWETLAEILQGVTGLNRFSTIEGLFNIMAKEVPALTGLEWAKIGDTGVNVSI